MKILVTGGAGFIGSTLVKSLLLDGHQVLNLDKLTYAGNIRSLDSALGHPDYQFVHGDICDQKLVERIFTQFRPNAVMHLAAESHVDRSIDSSAEFIQTNIVGTHVILEASRQYWNQSGASLKSNFRFHHISTDEVFGDLPHPDEDDNADSVLFSEESPYKPSSPYSASKASSDHLVRAWMRTYGLPVIVSNCSNNYGPYQFPEKLIPLMILNALSERELPVYGDGNQIRDWLYVEDHAEALKTILLDGDIGETYNVGGNAQVRNIELVNAICSALQVKRPTADGYHHLIKHVADRAGHDRRYAVDASKIRNQLRWQPRETLESGLEKTVSWYLKNQDWCRTVEDGSYRSNYAMANAERKVMQ